MSNQRFSSYCTIITQWINKTTFVHFSSWPSSITLPALLEDISIWLDFPWQFCIICQSLLLQYLRYLKNTEVYFNENTIYQYAFSILSLYKFTCSRISVFTAPSFTFWLDLTSSLTVCLLLSVGHENTVIKVLQNNII